MKKKMQRDDRESTNCDDESDRDSFEPKTRDPWSRANESELRKESMNILGRARPTQKEYCTSGRTLRHTRQGRWQGNHRRKALTRSAKEAPKMTRARELQCGRHEPDFLGAWHRRNQQGRGRGNEETKDRCKARRMHEPNVNRNRRFPDPDPLASTSVVSTARMCRVGAQEVHETQPRLSPKRTTPQVPTNYRTQVGAIVPGIQRQVLTTH